MTDRERIRRRLLAAVGPLALPVTAQEYVDHVLAVVLRAKGRR